MPELTRLQFQTRGTVTLFVVQLFSILSYSVLYSTLVLFMTNGLHLDDTIAAAITASFIAFNFVVRQFAGFIIGKFFSNRSLLIIGSIMQTVGAILLAKNILYLGMGFFLPGTAMIVTCINVVLGSFFAPNEHKKREKAYLWNYSGLNFGYLIGFTVSGFFENSHKYDLLFYFAAISNILTILMIIGTWHLLKDHKTFFSTLSKPKKNLNRIFGILILVAIAISLVWLIKYAKISNVLIILLGISMAFLMAYYAIKQKVAMTSKKLWAFFILTVMSLVFWTLYMTMPISLPLFIQNNIERSIFGFTIPPQWALNINAIIITFFGPMLIPLFKFLRNKGINISVPVQFTVAMFLIALAFIFLGVSTKFANKNGFISFNWIIIAYTLQSLGELFISPISYAMIGQLVPQHLHGIMMGVTMLVSGVGAVLSNLFSQMAIGISMEVDPLITNPYFAKIFYIMGLGTVVAAIIMFVLVPFLHKLIKLDQIDLV